MTKREIAFIVCRLLAIYLFMVGIERLSYSLSTLRDLSSLSTSFSGASVTINFAGRLATPLDLGLLVTFRLLPLVLDWFGALGLWIFAGEVSRRLFDGLPDEPEGEPLVGAGLAGAEVRAVAFGCLGLFFLAQDIPNLALWLISSIWDSVRWTQPSLPFGFYLPYQWLIRIPLSLWLIFGIRGIAGLWRLAQEKGLTPSR